jgi:O-antigen/teichoic acid export membrane protein
MGGVAVGCVALSFFIQDIVVLFFGDQYEMSGYILKYLIFFLPFAFYSLPFTTYFQASHNESLLLLVFAVAAMVNIPMNLVFFYSFGLIGIAYSTIVVFAVEGIILTILLYRKFRRKKD